MKTFTTILILLLFALLPSPFTCAAEQSPQPNIILIMLDDMGFSDIGCYGSEIETPNLDALAANGLRYRNFYNTGRCCPTRASLLTGLYSHQAGIGAMSNDENKPGYRGFLTDNTVTIAEALKPAGYTTMTVGKWHVGAKRPHWQIDRGFDLVYGVPEGGGYYFNMPTGRTLMLNDKPVETGPHWYATDAFTDYAIKFIEQNHTTNKPFFLYAAYNAPHFPLMAKPADIQKYRGKYKKGWDHLRQQRYQRMIEMNIIDQSWPLTPRDTKVSAWDNFDESKKDEQDLRMATYAAMIDNLDQNIGKLINTLDKLNLTNNTLIMFLADNGACAEGGAYGSNSSKTKAPTGTAESYTRYGVAWANASNTPFRLYKRYAHEGGIATPLIVHWPNGFTARNEFRDQTTHVIDLMATCLDAANATYPKQFKGKPITPTAGISLIPTFHNKPIPKRDLFWEHLGNRAIRSGKYKLVSRFPDPWELYDLQVDRAELNNLASKQPNRVNQMVTQYKTWADNSNVIEKRPKPKKN